MTAWLLITLCLKCYASYESFPGVASLVMSFGVQALQTNLQSCDSCIDILVWRASNAKALRGPMSKADIGVCSSERALPIGWGASSGSLSTPLNLKVGRPLPEQKGERLAPPSAAAVTSETRCSVHLLPALRHFCSKAVPTIQAYSFNAMPSPHSTLMLSYSQFVPSAEVSSKWFSSFSSLSLPSGYWIPFCLEFQASKELCSWKCFLVSTIVLDALHMIINRQDHCEKCRLVEMSENVCIYVHTVFLVGF